MASIQVNETQSNVNVVACRACGSKDSVSWATGLKDYLFGVPGDWNLVRCRNCGTLSLSPTPTPEQVASFYKQYFTHAPISSSAAGQSAGRRFRLQVSAALRAPFEQSGAGARAGRALLSLLVPRLAQTLRRSYAFQGTEARGRTSLDYGCGNGDLVRRLSRLGMRATGADFDEQALTAGRSAGLEVMNIASCERLDAESIDLLTCMNVIEHLIDPEATLRLFHRLLRRNGLLMIETPNADSWMARGMLGKWRGLEIPRHLSVYTEAGLTALLERAGFEVVATRFVPAAGFMAATSRLAATERRIWRLMSPWIDLLGVAVRSRREMIFLEARPRH